MSEPTTMMRNRFEVMGFEVFPSLMNDHVSAIFDDVSEQLASGKALRGNEKRPAVADFLGRCAAARQAAQNARLPDLAAQLLGTPANYLYGDASEFNGDTHWHSDGSANDVRLVKFVLYDRDLAADSGALRVIVGSHRWAPEYDVRAWNDEDVPGWSIDTRQGDVIAFDPRIKHAALGGRVRRQVAITYAARKQSAGAQVELLGLVLADHTIV
jgi:ectoine hydroxylase-related dioxygenase (phytanoyl-CoA dioxygenase family)